MILVFLVIEVDENIDEVILILVGDGVICFFIEVLEVLLKDVIWFYLVFFGKILDYGV